MQIYGQNIQFTVNAYYATGLIIEMENSTKILTVIKQRNIIISWFLWHFYDMPKFLFLAWENYIEFGLNYFSVPLLLSTLLSPWKKYIWRYPKMFSIGDYLSILISNIFSRFMGLIARSVLIISGIIAQILILIAGIFVILFWIMIPFILIALIFISYGI